MATAWLHVAAMPFPTYQGTQAVVREMCTASADAGRETHVFAYAAGTAHDDRFAFTLHRVGDFPRIRSLRSGPSAGKLLLDARMTVELALLVRRLGRAVVIAHHVEAAAMAAAAARPFVFFAHTDMEAELPVYGHARFGPALARAGRAIDHAVTSRAVAVAAISPVLADRARALAGDRAGVHYVPAPWRVPPPASDDERVLARRDLGIAATAPVVLYAGNLDAYQAWERAIEAFASLARGAPDARLVVGTASDPAPLYAAARHAGIADRVSVHAIDHEEARRRLHAAADVAVVPRRAPGGLPVKLLDALARGTPCVAAPTATAGLDLGAAAHVAEGDDAPALAGALRDVVLNPAFRRGLVVAGRAYVSEHHSRARFLDAFDRVAALAR